MATETLHFENARAAQQLFNHEPRNLQTLEAELGVKATARDARRAGLNVVVHRGATRAVEVEPGDGERAVAELRAAGVEVVD